MRLGRLLVLVVAVPCVGHAAVGRAAPEGANIEIVSIDLAGRQVNLTHDAAADLSPAVAHDGRIAFVSTRGDGADLYVMENDGSDVRRLTDHSGVVWDDALDRSQAAWSPRGDKIAFDGFSGAIQPGCLQHCAVWGVLTIGSDGSGLRQVAARARAPAWSPDGRRLAYESDIDAYGLAASVTVSRVDGSGSVRIPAVNNSSEVGPVWSSRGELAFQASSTDGAAMWIYVVNAERHRKRRLARGQNPSWSPDGRRLAFIDDYKLMTIGSDGKGKRRLSRKGEFVIGVAWSPKAGVLGYVAGTKRGAHGGLPSHFRVETVSADGKRVHVLRREPAASWIWGGPVWTRDGKRIVVSVETR